MDGFMIKDAAKMLGVESHVLRYWEEELGLEIKRNSMGHRYYDEKNIRMFRDIMDLKDRGLSLKDIRAGIEQMRKEKYTDNSEEIKNIHNNQEKDEAKQINYKEDKEEIVLRDIENKLKKENNEGKIVDFKMAQLQAVMNKLVANALRENKEIITTSIKSEITEDVMRQFDTVMREKEEKEEARFRKLDECLRQIQKANEEVAATKVRRKFGWRK